MTENNPTNSDAPVPDIDLNAPLDQIDPEAFSAFFSKALDEKPFKEQSVIKGRVIAVHSEHVVVDVNYKSEGIIAINEFRDQDGKIDIKKDDEVDVYLDRLEDDDGALILSKERADMMKAWDEISKAVEKDEVVEGVIVARVKGGLAVDIGVRAFLPGSQVDLRPVKNLDKLIGSRAKFKIIKFNKKRGNIVLSRRVLLEQEREERRKETLEKIEVGAIIDGTVKNITDYGAFIDLGGIDGLLHITDMSWGRINHPSELFKVGEEIQVRILKYDPENQRVSLGYKQIREDPWETAPEKYPIGAVVDGKVVSLPDYGAFIELEDGIEGLVHISEMTWNKRIKHPSKLLSIGDPVEAVVLDLDMENKRISLGMKQLETNPWDLVETKYPIGSVITGKVRNITDFGIFVGIEEGIDGLVHISDLSWGQRIKHPSEKYKKGDEVTAKVLNIDRAQERFSLSIKHLSEDPWQSVNARYFLGQTVQGEVVHVVDFGVFAELEDGVEGLIHVSELMSDGDLKEAYPVGKKLAATILSIDPHERKIGLSERTSDDGSEELPPPGEQAEAAQARLGDIKGAELLSSISIETAAAAEAAQAEEPADAPAEEAKAEEPEEAKAEEPKPEEPKAEEPEEAKAEEPKAEEPKAEEPKAEEAEEAKAEEPEEAKAEGDE